MSFLNNGTFLNTIRCAYRRKKLNTDSSMVSTYRCSITKPPKIIQSKVELFHRPKVMWTIFQILVVGAIALWTVRNYVHIIRSL